MLAEINQSSDHATGLGHLVEIEHQRKLGIGFHHPVLDWLKAQPRRGPALVFDINHIEQRMQALKAIAGSLSIRALVAVKSCPEPQYLRAANEHLDGFDISNPAEYACLPEDLQGKVISLTSPDLDVDLNSFVSRGNTAIVTLDSETQLARYFGQNTRMPYVLRIQGTDLLREAEPANYARTRFGFAKEEVELLVKQQKLLDCPPSGFHVHHGSERNTASTYSSMIRALKSLTQKHAIEPMFINLGGGWQGLSQDEITAVLEEARRVFPAPCTIFLEPGQWYGRNSGFATGTIVNHMESSGAVNYVVNLSRDCHLKWSDAKLVYPMEARPKKFCEVQFFGASCYEADRIGTFMLPYSENFTRESGFTTGRQVVFSNISLYSAAWNTSFNGVPEAEIVWWKH